MPKSAWQKLNLSALEYRSDPLTAFGKLRAQGPMVPARLFGLGKFWMATTYEACDEVLKNDRLFCRNPINAGRKNFVFFQMMLPGVFQRLAKNMLSVDEPDHRRLRTLVDQAFQRRSISDLSPSIERLVDSQIERLPELASSGNSVDLVEQLARPIPLAIICELLGLPDSDRAQFKKWFAGFANIKSIFGIFKMVPGLRKTIKYLDRQFEEVKNNPRPGLLSALVEAEQTGERLSDNELTSMVMLLLLAGHETTVHLISTSILTLLQLPQAKSELLEDPTRSQDFVDEMLRINSPAQFAKPRFVTEDSTFYGVPLKRGDSIMPALASANLDPQRFCDPGKFDWRRKDNHHLGFGSGPHVCLGLKLARRETEIVLTRLFQKLPDLQANFDLDLPDWSQRLGFRSLSTLSVRLFG